MFPSTTKMQAFQTLLLFVHLGLLLWGRGARYHQGTVAAIQAMAANCAYDLPGAYRPVAAGASSTRWCADSSQKEMLVLMNHLRIHCKHDFCVAAEFGSSVAVAYMPFMNTMVINPASEAVPEAESIDCRVDTDAGEMAYRTASPTWLTYTNDKFVPTRIMLHNKGACISHLLLQHMYGK